MKNQISSLTIDINTNENTRPNRSIIEALFTHIFSMFPNLQILNLAQNAFWHQHLSFDTLSPTVMSSTLLELSVCLVTFDDCLRLLGGHFNQLHTFDVKIDFIPSSPQIIDNKVD